MFFFMHIAFVTIRFVNHRKLKYVPEFGNVWKYREPSYIEQQLDIGNRGVVFAASVISGTKETVVVESSWSMTPLHDASSLLHLNFSVPLANCTNVVVSVVKLTEDSQVNSRSCPAPIPLRVGSYVLLYALVMHMLCIWAQSV